MKYVPSSLAVLLSALLITSPVPAQPLPADAPAAADAIQVRLLSQAESTFQVNSVSKAGLEVAVTDAAGAPVPDAAVAFRLPDSGASGTFPDGSRSVVRYTDSTGRATAPLIRWNNTAGPLSIRITAAKGAGHAGLLVDATLTSGAASSSAAEVNHPRASLASASVLPATAPKQDSDNGELELAHSGAADTDLPVADEAPSVSITSASPGGGPHISKKWIILAAVAAAAGVGAMLALHGGGGSSGASSAGVSIGSPSISIGHP